MFNFEKYLTKCDFFIDSLKFDIFTEIQIQTSCQRKIKISGLKKF